MARTTTTGSTNVTLDPWIRSVLENTYNTADWLSAPFLQNQPQSLVAPLNDTSQAFIRGATNLPGSGQLNADANSLRGMNPSANLQTYQDQLTQPTNINFNPIATPGQVTAPTIQAAQTAALNPVTAAQVGPAKTAADFMDLYKNPYEQDVVSTMLADLAEAKKRADNAASMGATAAGAFGNHSGAALRQAQVDDDYLRTVGSASAGVRSQGFRDRVGFGGADASRRLTGDIANAQLQQQASLFNSGQTAAQAEANAAREQQASGLNAAHQLNASQFNTTTGLNAAQFNATTGLQNEQFLAGLRQAGIIGAGDLAATGNAQDIQALTAAAGITNTANANDRSNLAMLGAAGEMQQGYDQSVAEQPMRALQMRLAAAGLLPNLTNTESTETARTKPGLFDWLSAAAGPAATIIACWVAREVYGAENPRWLTFREWMFTKAPKWFLRLYIQHGARFAEFISDKPRIKALIRRWMDARIGG
ncbi:MAG TPA: hypothetical protein VD994_06435 [Prosthecobacter sp.]|nr:hypothetical protein [Prosthecobacter sp.]